MNFVDGAAPRFGSCCLVLHASIANRCAFSFGDSSTPPNVYGTSKQFAPVLFALLNMLIESAKLLDCLPMTIHQAMEAMARGFPRHTPQNGRENCRTIETHIHGSIFLLDDIEAIYMDASLADTDTHKKVMRLCDQYHIKLCWLPKRYVLIDDIDDASRGPLMKPIPRCALEALEVAGDG